jgi:hypothetical protein
VEVPARIGVPLAPLMIKQNVPATCRSALSRVSVPLRRGGAWSIHASLPGELEEPPFHGNACPAINAIAALTPRSSNQHLMGVVVVAERTRADLNILSRVGPVSAVNHPSGCRGEERPPGRPRNAEIRVGVRWINPRRSRGSAAQKAGQSSSPERGRAIDCRQRVGRPCLGRCRVPR